jgi:hypothetical protein
MTDVSDEDLAAIATQFGTKAGEMAESPVPGATGGDAAGGAPSRHA